MIETISVTAISVSAIIFALWCLGKKFHLGSLWRGFFMRRQAKQEGPFPYQELIDDNLPMAACADFGAFKKPLQKLPGMKTIVLMFERTADEYILSYDSYMPGRRVPLDRHGPLKFYSTETDLRNLVEDLHKQGVKVLIGFWAFWGDLIHRPGPWVKRHRELKPRRWGEADFGNLFVTLKPEGVTLAKYIAGQYKKLRYNFGFDGLFLGDGFCGYRNFFEPWQYRDKKNTVEQLADFYRLIAEMVHKTGGQLWAYDCLGFSYEESVSHGADLKLLAKAGLDVLVFQSYPTAWGEYFRISGKTDLIQEVANFPSVKEALLGTSTHLYYSLELGDSVEGWWPSWEATRLQMESFRKRKADGKFLVWGNDSLGRCF